MIFADANPVDGAGILNLLYAMVGQILNSPGSLLEIIALSIIAFVFETVHWLPTKAILPICVFGGALTYWIFNSPASVPPYFPYPAAVLFVNGLVCGLVAFALHASLVVWIIERFTKSKPPAN